MFDHDDFAWAPPSELRTAPPFSDLFPVNPATLGQITESMKRQGYDPSRPVNVWRQANLVIDGHTRVRAAIAARTGDIPVCFHDFKDEDEAVEYAVRAQVERRQLTDAEVFRAVKELDRRAKKGGDRGNQHTGGKASREALPDTKKSAAETASKVKTSRAKVEAARTVADHAQEFPDIEKSVIEDGKSLRAAAKEVTRRRREKANPPAETPPPKVEAAPKKATPKPADPPPFDADARFDAFAALAHAELEGWPPEVGRVFAMKLWGLSRLILTRFDVTFEEIKSAKT